MSMKLTGSVGVPRIKTYGHKNTVHFEVYSESVVYLNTKEFTFSKFFSAVIAHLKNKVFAESDPRLELVRCIQSMHEVPGYGVHDIPAKPAAVRYNIRRKWDCKECAGVFGTVRIWGELIDPQDLAVAVEYVFTNSDLKSEDMRRRLVEHVFPTAKILPAQGDEPCDNPFGEPKYKIVFG